MKNNKKVKQKRKIKKRNNFLKVEKMEVYILNNLNWKQPRQPSKKPVEFCS